MSRAPPRPSAPRPAPPSRPAATPPSGEEEPREPVMPPKPGLVWGGNANYKPSD